LPGLSPSWWRELRHSRGRLSRRPCPTQPRNANCRSATIRADDFTESLLIFVQTSGSASMFSWRIGPP
jgi:hypothetical protein